MSSHKRVSTTLTLTFLLFMIAALTGFSGSNEAKLNNTALHPPDPPGIENSQSISNPAAVIDIFITEQGFSPPVESGPPGTTIRWTNQTSQTVSIESSVLAFGATSHLFFFPVVVKGQEAGQSDLIEESSSDSLQANSPWASGDIPPGASFSRTFDQPGEYPYQQTNASGISGIIYIQVGRAAFSSTSLFAEVAVEAGLATTGAKEGGLSWADFDNDGCLDVLVNTDTGHKASRLYQQQIDEGSCTGSFSDVTESLAPGLLENGKKERSAIWGDVNNDGHPDFAVNRLSRIEIYLNNGPIHATPFSFGKITEGSPTQAITSFTDTASASCPNNPDTFNTEAMGWVDYDGDGDLDLIVDNHNHSTIVFENDGTGSFEDLATTDVGFPGCDSADGGDYGAFTDYDVDGDVDVLDRKENAFDIWQNDNGFFTPNENFDAEARTNNKGGAAFCDFDNDGDFDLFWTDNDTNQIWRNDDSTFVETGLPADITGNIDGVTCGDADNDGDLDLFLTSNGDDLLYLNSLADTGSLEFTQDNLGITGSQDGEGTAIADYDRDGDLDLLINQDHSNELWQNGLNNDDYLIVRALRVIDEETSRDDIGATITLTDCENNLVTGVREVNGGRGHGSQDPAYVHFGLPAGPDASYIVNVQFLKVEGEITTVRRSVIPSQINGYQLAEIKNTDVDDLSSCQLTVGNTNNDGPGSLRQTILNAGAIPGLDTITFDIPGPGPHTIQLTDPLEIIDDPIVIDGTTQPGASCDPVSSDISPTIVLDGSTIATTAPISDGLNISAGDSTVSGLQITGFGSDGINLNTNGNNRVECNIITQNGENGVRVTDGVSNTVQSNAIFDNGQLGIDLDGDGVTLNDPGDPDGGANNRQNTPVLFKAVPTANPNDLEITGRHNGALSTNYTVQFFANSTCDPTSFGEGEQLLGSLVVTTNNDSNDLFFTETVTTDPPVPEGYFITATATDPDGNTSEFSPCVIVSPDNDIWTRALPVSSGDTVMQFIDVPGRSRWYKFPIQPESKVIINLTDLPADYDLFLYKDIQQTFDDLTSPDSNDLLRLSAEFAPGSPSPGSPSPGSPSPGSPSPGSPSPGSPSLNQYAPGSPSPGSPSPGSPSPGSPSLYDFAPGSPSPGSPSPGSPSPGSPSFASAETRSFVSLSATAGSVDELIVANTWNNSGNFYVRYTGNNGVFSLSQPATIDIEVLSGSCSNLSLLEPQSEQVVSGNYETLIIHNLGRMKFDDTNPNEVAAFNDLPNKLDQLAQSVNGYVLDVGQDNKITALNQQADSFPECPFAKNLVAESIKSIIDKYRKDNPGMLKHIVIIGNDDDNPFFRYPDRTLLGRESSYAPPVEDNTASQASLQLDYILSQIAYGSQDSISVSGTVLPIPDIPVGRLVETPTDITIMIDTFLQLQASTGGRVSPQSALVTGYDFLEDGALDVVTAVTSDNGITDIDTELIVDQELPPEDGWDADALRSKLLSRRHDLVYLAGHFSANSALAADYDTSMITTDLTNSSVDLSNAIVFSPGCHSGYNIVNDHNLEGFTFEPDWAQAFAQKGATLIAGTGYQYGDTEFVEYSERLYLNFARELRTRESGQETVSIGQALVNAQNEYLAGTPFLRGMHEKALLQATLFGLPMLQVAMPGDPFDPPNDSSIVGATTPVPGNALGLETAEVSLAPNTIVRALDNVNNIDNSGQVVTLTWLQGKDGVVTNPGEPVLPRHVSNVSVSGKVLRGVGFVGGSYIDEEVRPLVGRPTTELAPVLSSFFSDTFFPGQPWNVNYFDALGRGNATRIIALPAQIKSSDESDPSDPLSIRRKYTDMGFRLYYVNDQTDPLLDLVDASTIVNVSASLSEAFDSISFDITVVGDPAVKTEKCLGNLYRP